jgi:hypothetical protein
MSQSFYIFVSYLAAFVIIGGLVSKSVSRFKKAKRDMARVKAQKGE